MKKNFSFVRRVCALSTLVVACTAAFASGTTNVWTVPSAGSVAPGATVSFIGFESGIKYVLPNDGSACAQLSTVATSKLGFEVASGNTANTLVFVGADGKYLKNNGQVIANSLLPEVEWQYTYNSATDQRLYNVPANGYLYYESARHEFGTTAASMGVAAYVKRDVQNASITDNGAVSGTEITKIEGSVIKLRYSSEATLGPVNPVITVKTDETASDMVYGVQYATSTPSADAASLVWTDATGTPGENHSFNIELSTLTHGTDVKVWARTVVYTQIGANYEVLDVTDATSQVYRIVDLDDPVITGAYQGEWNGATNHLKVALDGTAGVAFDPCNAKFDDDADFSGVVGYLNGEKFYSHVGEVVNISLRRSNDGFTTKVVEKAITVDPYFSSEEAVTLFGHVNTTPASQCVHGGTADAVGHGETITISYTKSTDPKYATFSIAAQACNVTFKEGSNLYTVAASVNGSNLQAVVPSQIPYDKSFSVIVPAQAFIATTASETKSPKVNTFYNTEHEVSFNNKYSVCYYQIEDPFKEIETTTQTITLKVFSQANPQNDVKSLLTGSKAATITNSGNVEISQAYTVVKGANPNEFIVTFTNNDLPAGDYMIVFPAATLLDNTAAVTTSSDNTNTENVTAYLNVKEKVMFSYTLNDAKCTTENVILNVLTSTNTVAQLVENKQIFVDGNPVTVTIVGNGNGGSIDLGKLSAADHTIEIPEGAFKSNNSFSLANNNVSGNAVNTLNKTIYQHVVFTFPAAANAKEGFTVANFNVAVNDGTSLVYDKDNVIVYGSGSTAVKAHIVIDQYGAGTVTLKNGATFEKNKVYNVTIPANAWTSVCGHKSQVATIQFSVNEMVLTVAAAEGITTHDTQAAVSVSAVWGASAIQGTATLGAATNVTLKKGSNSYPATLVLNGTNWAIDGFAALSAGDYTVNYLADAIRVDGASCKAGSFTLNVQDYVNFSIVSTPLRETTEQTHFDFTINALKDNGEVYAAAGHPTITDNQSILNVIAINDGENSYPVTLTFKERNSNDQFVYTATTATGLVANNYQLHLPVGALSANNNSNAAILYGNISIKNYVEFRSATAELNLDAAATTAELELVAEDMVDHANIIANATVSVDGWTINGNAVTVNATSAGHYTLSFSALQAGDYTLEIPAEALKANYSKSGVISVPVHVLAVVPFGVQMTTVNEQATSVAIKVSDAAATYSKVAGHDLTLTDKNHQSTTVTVWDINNNGEIEFAVSSLTRDLSIYELAIPAGAIKANNTLCPAFDGAAIKVIKEFTFNDGAETSCTTRAEANAKVAQYDTLRYNRHFSNGKLKALYVPITFKATAEMLEAVNIWKLSAVTVDNNVTNMHFSLVAADDMLYANKPYLIASKTAGENTVELKMIGAELEAPEVKSITCETVLDKFTFTGVVSDQYWYAVNTTPGAYWYLSDSKGSLVENNAATERPLWSWYLTVADKGVRPHYIQVITEEEDGTETVTGLEDIIANDVNVASEGIYTITGQKLSEPIHGTVNIINGKKVFVQ